MQGRKESYLSLHLKRSMNMTCRVMTYQELLSYQKSLDEQDDAEHDKMMGLLKEKKDMDSHFSKRLSEIVLKGGDLSKLQKEITDFNNNHEKRLKKVLEIREYLEEEDDKTRDLLFKHTHKCHRSLREENEEIDKRLVEENLNKKLISIAI